jgi:hypothetical protein
MADPNTSRLKPGGRFLIIAGWSVFVLLMAAVMWQKSVESNKLDESRDHLIVAMLIEDAEADGISAGLLLGEYVNTGDEALLQQMQDKTATGVRTLADAIDKAGGDPEGFVSQGSELVQASGQIIAMRQAGRIEEAGVALAELGPTFTAFIDAQTAYVASERGKAGEATDAADAAQTMALVLLMAALITGITMIVVTMVLARVKSANRRVVGPLSGDPA